MKQYVCVIIHSANGNGSHFLVLANSSHLRPQFRSNVFGNNFDAIFCAENQVQMIFDKCMGHRMSPLRGLHSIFSAYPPLTRVGSIISSLRDFDVTSPVNPESSIACSSRVLSWPKWFSISVHQRKSAVKKFLIFSVPPRRSLPSSVAKGGGFWFLVVAPLRLVLLVQARKHSLSRC